MSALSDSRAMRECVGFTLVELLAALIITSLLIVALVTVLGTAFAMRDSTTAQLEETDQTGSVLGMIKSDLKQLVPPGELLAGAILGERVEESGGIRADSLEFYSASGSLEVDKPWGDIQKVVYSLREPEDDDHFRGYELVRKVTRNLLPSLEEESSETVLLNGVKSLEFQYYSEETWQDTWDSSANDDAPPEAVSVHIELIREGATDHAPPLELLCAVVAESAVSDETVQ
ncbi:MAG: GspJ family type II secretion system protein [Candidatus Hydrogenedentes bacterium]|nr:GspJ family type II secretion system protein [Candidatus Hydrogenedentota bacterium]